MSGQRHTLPRIPSGGWRERAACTERVREQLWDDRVDGETEVQRRKRHLEARLICNECPVRIECADDVDWEHDEGVRGGHTIPPLEERQAS